MKQQYRHTRPYRGKDPNFDTEELNEANDPCYACGDSGLQSYDSWQLEQTANWEEISCTTV